MLDASGNRYSTTSPWKCPGALNGTSNNAPTQVQLRVDLNGKLLLSWESAAGAAQQTAFGYQVSNTILKSLSLGL